MDDLSYRLLQETPSTNTFAKEHLADFSQEYSVIYTQKQTAGRGMEGNHWESEEGKNIAFSIVCQPKTVKPMEQFILSMAIAVDIITVLQQMFPKEKEHFRIKWPNDIYWKDKKLGGILIENSLKGFRLESCIIGIGINVNQEVFKSDAPNPISLKQIFHRETDAIELMKNIAERFRNTLQVIKLTETESNNLLNSKYESIRADYHRLLYRFDNKPYTFQEGDNLFKAKIRKVNNDGKLVLVTANDEEKEFWIKEVKFII